MAKIYSIKQKGCTEEDFLYVSAVDDEPSLFVAFVLFKGEMSKPLISKVSFEDAKKKGDAWIAANLNGATTSYRREM